MRNSYGIASESLRKVLWRVIQAAARNNLAFYNCGEFQANHEVNIKSGANDPILHPRRIRCGADVQVGGLGERLAVLGVQALDEVGVVQLGLAV